MNKSPGTNNLFSRKSSYGHEYSSTTQSNSLSMIDDFLESEKATNNTEQWTISLNYFFSLKNK
jgi:hypothetical protein